MRYFVTLIILTIILTLISWRLALITLPFIPLAHYRRVIRPAAQEKRRSKPRARR